MFHTRLMRIRWLLPVLVGASLVFAASASSADVLPACTAGDRLSPVLVSRGGYQLACGPGSAVVTFNGTTYRMNGSRCFISSRGARLYFGAQRFDRPSRPSRNGLYLVVAPNRVGPVPVIDGGVGFASGLRTAIVGAAQTTDGLREGTFTIYGHRGNGKADRRRFTGGWDCG
jgi:uncharacterized Zn-binding protein involved in type VI secretion